MIEPGVYRHYKKGDLYRVLFTAVWADYERPVPDANVSVYLDGTRVSAACGHRKTPRVLMTVQWSGNTCHPEDENAVAAGDVVVIYVALYGEGRLSVRTEIEFAEHVTVKIDSSPPSSSALMTSNGPRFERIGS